MWEGATLIIYPNHQKHLPYFDVGCFSSRGFDVDPLKFLDRYVVSEGATTDDDIDDTTLITDVTTPPDSGRTPVLQVRIFIPHTRILCRFSHSKAV